MEKIKVMISDLPLSVKGVTVEKNGIYHIVINSNYGFEGRNEILKEELESLNKLKMIKLGEEEKKIG